MFRYMYGLDIYYLVLIVPCILLSMWAQHQVHESYNKYAQIYNQRGITAMQAAQRILEQNGVFGIRFERIAGHLTDCFDPRSNTIYLSDGIMQSTSVAAIGIACHEAGHAIQYAKQYAPVKMRMAILPVTQFGAQMSWPVLVFGLIFRYQPVITIGIALFALSTLFQLVTLPVEIDASRRALRSIEAGCLLAPSEYGMAKKTLTAAAMTYVAALATSLFSLLRLILLFGGQRRND